MLLEAKWRMMIMANMELSEKDRQVDYLFNVVFDVIGKVDSLPELEIYYAPRGVVADSFEGASDISGKVKVNTSNRKSLDSMCAEYRTNLGEVGFAIKDVRTPAIDTSSIPAAQAKLDSVKENYSTVKNNFDIIVNSMLSGDDNAPYAQAIAQMQSKTGALEGGAFYWDIPLKPFIQYADSLKKVLEDGIDKFGMHELKPIYDDLESGLRHIASLRMYSLMHPSYKGLVTPETAENVLKYEARKTREAHASAPQENELQLHEVIEPKKE
jgi:hypothetical protein